MITNQFGANEWADQYRRALRTRHTHQDALTDREFERLLEGCEQLPESRRFETRCICSLAGRLGLCAGEMTHLTTDWLDWDRKLVRIPSLIPAGVPTVAAKPGKKPTATTRSRSSKRKPPASIRKRPLRRV